jgi:mono/diheme cytochrome c family protein
MFTRFRSAGVILALLATAGCGTRVGTQSNASTSTPGHGPIVVATAIGQKPTSASGASPVAVTVRSGADVVLSGKDSDSTDAAIDTFNWKQTGGPALPDPPDTGALLYRTSNTVSFRAPLVAPGAPPLTFRLTVTDARGVSATADVSVTVLPPSDQDQLLQRPDLLHTFNIAVLTTDGLGGNPLTTDAPVCVQVSRTINYKTRNAGITGPNSTSKPLALTPLQFDTAWKSGTTVAGAGADGSAADAAAASFSNPRATFELPSLNDEEIFARYNQPGSSNRPDLQLVPGDVDTAQMQVAVNAIAGTCASTASGAPTGPAAGTSLIVALLGSDGRVKLKSAPSVGSSTLSQDASSGTLTSDALLMAVTPTQTQTIAGHATTFSGTPIETAASADAYYAAIDPTGSKKTLTAWLAANCFDPAANDYGVGKAAAGNGAHSVYTNNYDLGFGRDMYFIRCATDHTDSAGKVTAHAGDMASVVINYPSLEQAALKQATIIAVAMEYGASADGSAPTRRFTKFYAFAPDDRTGEFTRVRSANFDKRGQKYLPGSCTACHAGTLPNLPTAFSGPATGGACSASSYDVNSCYPLVQDPLAAQPGQPATPTCAPGSAPGTAGCLPPGDVDSAFLPWDIDSLLYSDTDPAFKGKLVPGAPYIQAAQEPSLKVLNQLAHATFKYGVDANGADIVESVIPATGTKPVDRYAAAKALTEHWYGGPGFPNPKYADYTDTDPPDGWKDQPVPLYHTVFARNCRTCHTVDADTRLQFSGLNQEALAANKLPDGYQKIVQEFAPTTNGQPGKGLTYIFQQGLMPLARLTMDRFWVDFNNGTSAGNTLATAMQQKASLVGQPVINAALDPANTTLTPGVAVDGVTSNGAHINATGSSFVAKYSWTLAVSPLQSFTSDLSSPACTPGGAGSPHPLVGDTSTTPGFFIDKSGLYRATLTPNNGVGQSGTASTYEYDVCVPNFQPAWAPTANASCNTAPAAPFQTGMPGGSKTLGLPACFTGLRNAPYTLGVSSDGSNFASIATGQHGDWNASVICNGSASACDSPDVRFNFTGQANPNIPVTVYFKLCDVDGDCTPVGTTGSARLDVNPTSLRIQSAALVMYWAPCLNPQADDSAETILRCPTPALTNTLTSFPAGGIPIQSPHPKAAIPPATASAPTASMATLGNSMVLTSDTTPLTLSFDSTFATSLTGLPVSAPANNLLAALSSVKYKPSSWYANSTAQSPFVTSDIHGKDLATGTVAPTLIPFSYMLAAAPTPTVACGANFSVGSSTCQGTVEIRALTSFSRSGTGEAQAVFAIFQGPAGISTQSSCNTGGCHKDQTLNTSWTLASQTPGGTPDKQRTYNSICNTDQPPDTVTTRCNTPATAKVPSGSTARSIVVPGDPDNSLLYTAACLGKGNASMPRTFNATDAQCQIIYQWILEGASNN